MSKNDNTYNSKQHGFIDQFIKRKAQVSLFLCIRIQLRGIIAAVDKYVVILKGESAVQLIYKHAIASIQKVSHAV